MVTIEPPAPAEVETVADLWLSLARDQRRYGSHLCAAENRTVVENELSRSLVAGGLLVAREDEEIVGFVMFGVDSGSYEQDVTRGTVHNLFVRPEARDRGIGTELLTVAEETLAAMGATAVAIGSMAANEGARRLYRRCGYEPHRVELEKYIETDNPSSENR